jgi:hypothetical protein
MNECVRVGHSNLALAPRPSLIYCASPLINPLLILHFGWNVWPFLWGRHDSHLVPRSTGPGDEIINKQWPRNHIGCVADSISSRHLSQVGSSVNPSFSTLKMEAIRSSETSVHTRSTQRHIPEDVILQNSRGKPDRLVSKLHWIISRLGKLIFQYTMTGTPYPKDGRESRNHSRNIVYMRQQMTSNMTGSLRINNCCKTCVVISLVSYLPLSSTVHSNNFRRGGHYLFESYIPEIAHRVVYFSL